MKKASAQMGGINNYGCEDANVHRRGSRLDLNPHEIKPKKGRGTAMNLTVSTALLLETLESRLVAPEKSTMHPLQRQIAEYAFLFLVAYLNEVPNEKH